MRVLMIGDKDKKYYEDMVAPQLRFMLHRSELFTFGLIKEDEDGKAEPVGVAIVSDEGRDFILQWLYVPEECRGMGYGDILIDHLFSLAEEYEKERVGVKIWDTTGTDEEDHGIEFLIDYFRERGFVESAPGEVNILVNADLLVDKKVPGKKNEDYDIKSLCDLPQAIERTIKERIREERGTAYADGIDSAVSMVYQSEGKVLAAFTIRGIDSTFMPVELHISQSVIKRNIIGNLIVETFEAVYGKNKNSTVYLECSRYEQLAGILPLFEKGLRLESRTFYAVASEISLDEKRLIEEIEMEKKADELVESIPAAMEIVDVEYFSGVDTGDM